MSIALLAATPSAHASATTPPAAPPVTNDLLPDNDNITDCIGTLQRPNCGSKARADGHTYLVFAVLAAGMTFIGWRIARGVKARDQANQPVP